jgi:hypothetical protein
MRRSRRDPSARALIVPLVMLPALFALLIRLKLANYLVTIYPVLAISLSLWAVRLWDKTRGMHPAAVWRVAMLAAALAVVAEGGSRISALEEQARATTPYYNFIGRVRLNVPEGAGVLGLHRYWFGMEDHPYRSFVVPIWWADPSRTSPPLPLADGLQRIGPDVVLVDGAMRSYFQSQAARDAGYSEAFDKWLSRRQAYLVGSVVDPAYGRLDIFRLTR